MGKTITEGEKGKKTWDSNAITPGTPFMSFLAASLRYWVRQKMNTDPGWKNVRTFNKAYFMCIILIRLIARSHHF